MNLHDAIEMAFENGYEKGAMEAFDEVKRIAEDVNFKNNDEKQAFFEMLDAVMKEKIYFEN